MKQTPNLGLTQMETPQDGNKTFNIGSMINEPFDRIDKFAGETRKITGNIGNLYVWEQRKTNQSGVITGYPASVDKSTYPADGMQGGYYYRLLGQIGEPQDVPHVQVVSYVGTGLYGAAHPCSIRVGFPIKAISIIGYVTNTIFYDPSTQAQSTYGPQACWSVADIPNKYSPGYALCEYIQNVNRMGKLSNGNKTYSWYVTDGHPSTQFNEKNTKYYLLVIG